MSERRSAPYDKVRSLLDYHMVQMSWMYDLNYPPSFRILVDTGLFEWTAGRLPADEVRDVLDEVRERVSEMLRSS